MSSSPRLEQLRRQRALLQEHLAWLDREIAGEMISGRPTAPSASGPAPSGYRAPLPPSAPSPAAAAGISAAPAAVPGTFASPGTGVDVDELFERLRADDQKENAPPSKTGCWIAFAVILLVVVGAVGAVFFFLYR